MCDKQYPRGDEQAAYAKPVSLDTARFLPQGVVEERVQISQIRSDHHRTPWSGMSVTYSIRPDWSGKSPLSFREAGKSVYSMTLA